MARAHGSELRGLFSVPLSEGPAGRFGRLFRFLPPAQYGDDFDQSKEALTELAETMIAKEFAHKDKQGKKRDPTICESEPEDENPTIPAGYTYLGQFIDHDITFDPVSTLQAENDPDALEDFRTPRLDFDSVYGRGLADQPYLYSRDRTSQDTTGEFLLGADRKAAGHAPRPDVPRNAGIIWVQWAGVLWLKCWWALPATMRTHSSGRRRGGSRTPRWLARMGHLTWHG